MKKVRRILPVSLYDIPGLESWLEEQAAQGLFPVRLGRWAVFRTGAVPGTRFRLESWGDRGTEPAPEQLELYQRQGWEYALPVGRTYFLFYAQDPEAIELYTDYQSRGMSLERAQRQLRRVRAVQFLIYALGALLVLMAAYNALLYWSGQRSALLSLMKNVNPFMVLALGADLILGVFQSRDLRTLRAACRALKDGLPPPPSPGPSRLMRWANGTSLALTILIAACLGCHIYFQREGGVPLDRFSPPYVTFSDLGEPSLVSYEMLTGRPGTFEGNQDLARYIPSLLAPVWYEVRLQGFSPEPGDYEGYSPDPEGGKYRYHATLEQTRIRALSSSLARAAALAKLDQYPSLEGYWREVDCPGLDFAVVADREDDTWQLAALGKGRDAAVFFYAGQERLADHLDALAELILDETEGAA